jgi:hypothetical protein
MLRFIAFKARVSFDLAAEQYNPTMHQSRSWLKEGEPSFEKVPFIPRNSPVGLFGPRQKKQKDIKRNSSIVACLGRKSRQDSREQQLRRDPRNPSGGSLRECIKRRRTQIGAA